MARLQEYGTVATMTAETADKLTPAHEELLRSELARELARVGVMPGDVQFEWRNRYADICLTHDCPHDECPEAVIHQVRQQTYRDLHATGVKPAPNDNTEAPG